MNLCAPSKNYTLNLVLNYSKQNKTKNHASRTARVFQPGRSKEQELQNDHGHGKSQVTSCSGSQTPEGESLASTQNPSHAKDAKQRPGMLPELGVLPWARGTAWALWFWTLCLAVLHSRTGVLRSTQRTLTEASLASGHGCCQGHEGP